MVSLARGGPSFVWLLNQCRLGTNSRRWPARNSSSGGINLAVNLGELKTRPRFFHGNKNKWRDVNAFVDRSFFPVPYLGTESSD